MVRIFNIPFQHFLNGVSLYSHAFKISRDNFAHRSTTDIFKKEIFSSRFAFQQMEQ